MKRTPCGIRHCLQLCNALAHMRTVWGQDCTARKALAPFWPVTSNAYDGCRAAQDPAQRLTLPQAMAHPWVTAGGSLRPLQSSGGRPAAAVAAKRGLATAFDGACITLGGATADGAAADGPAVAAALQQAQSEQQQQPQQAQQQQTRTPQEANAEAAAAPEAADTEEEADAEQQPQQTQTQLVAEAAEAEEADAEQEALLKASLEGLVTGDLQVHSFAAGEPLMRRGQPGGLLRWRFGSSSCCACCGLLGSFGVWQAGLRGSCSSQPGTARWAVAGGLGVLLGLGRCAGWAGWLGSRPLSSSVVCPLPRHPSCPLHACSQHAPAVPQPATTKCRPLRLQAPT